MGSLSTHSKGDAGEWKGGHMRIGSAAQSSSGTDSNSKRGGDVELQKVRDDEGGSEEEEQYQPDSRRRSKFQFPRLGLGAAFRDGRPEDNGVTDGTVEFYKVYRRRWFGLIELTLLSLLVSWEVSCHFLFAVQRSHLDTTPSRRVVKCCTGR